MIDYSQNSLKVINVNNTKIHSFLQDDEDNVDWATVQSFGVEWNKFNDFTEDELKYGYDYFDLVTKEMLNNNSLVLDVGCGSGRWTKFIANRVQFVEAIDPSSAILTAFEALKDIKNTRVTSASVNNLPFKNESFDFVFSLGVLHHLPDTPTAIKKCINKVKNGGYFLVYLYYALDNRGFLYKLIFHIVSIFRKMISKLPFGLRKFVCDVIAFIAYWPLSRLCRLLEKTGVRKNLIHKIPLSYYSTSSIKILRNDSYDRFGTPLEKRFSKFEIENMLTEAGLINIQFSNNPPYWHAIGKKK